MLGISFIKRYSNIMKTALTFDDVQIVPNYSEVPTRKGISGKCRITKTWELKIPITSAPMDTITEWEMAKTLADLGAIGFIHRFMDIEEQVTHVRRACQERKMLGGIIGAAVGVKSDYLSRAVKLKEAGASVILIDVAHGHHIAVKRSIKLIKEACKNIDIIAGNVATYRGALALCKWGVDAIRCGIGGGCFLPNSLVWTNEGYQPIQNIRAGDKALTHTGQYKPVTTIYQFDRDEEILEINDIKCTKNHEFYVIHKNDADKINNDKDLHKYAKWIRAQNLTEDYVLIERLD